VQAANGVNVSQPIVDMMQRLTFLNACTFSFATHANPLTQHMYECTTCNQTVCVICMVRSRARDGMTLRSPTWFVPPGTVGYLSFGSIDKIFMFSVTLACARRTGAAARVERRRRER
jgi:hypothetical protein